MGGNEKKGTEFPYTAFFRAFRLYFGILGEAWKTSISTRSVRNFVIYMEVK